MEHGRHIKVLGLGSADALRSVSGIKGFLVDLIHSLGMRPLGDTHMYEVLEELEKMSVEPFEDEGGTTGVCVLSTSHCAIHTWPLRNFFVMDIYSCRDFDPTEIRRMIVSRLGVNKIRITDLSESLEPDFEDVTEVSVSADMQAGV